MWRILTNSLHVRNYQRILHMCEALVPILHMCEELVPILHTREKVAPVLHRCDEYLPILHTSEIINMRNLSTNFSPKIYRNRPYVNFTFGKYLANVTYWYQFFLWVWNLRNEKFTVQQRLTKTIIRSRIRVKKLCIIGYPECAQWKFWSDCANALADPKRRWAQKSKGTFLTLRFKWE